VSAIQFVSDDDLNRAWLRHYDADPLFRYSEGVAGGGGMSPGQEAFHRDPSRRRVLRAGNQVGKTRAGAAECWWTMLDRHPWREPLGRASVGWCIMPDLNDWPKVSTKLREIEPPGVLDPACRYDTAKGFTYRGARGLMTRNGSLALPKSGTQQQTALAGDTLDWLWYNEPPRESHWGESLSRLAVRGGHAWLEFTPVGKPLGWLRAYLHGDAETGAAGHAEWSETLIELKAANCPHRTPADIAAQVASYSPWEYAQRVEGAWEGVTVDRYLSAFGESCVVDPDTLPAMERIGLGMDHGEGIGKEFAVLVGWDGFRLWALDEYSAGANSTPATDAAGVLAMLTRWGLTPAHVHLCKGDINSAGKLGAGLSVNDIMEREFARLARMSRPPFRIETPAKGRGSVDAGRRTLNNAFISGRAFVLPSCPRLIHACRHWRGGQDLKDPVDAYRYIAVEFLDERPSGSSRLTMI
jgi:hypothetical protein